MSALLIFQGTLSYSGPAAHSQVKYILIPLFFIWYFKILFLWYCKIHPKPLYINSNITVFYYHIAYIGKDKEKAVHECLGLKARNTKYQKTRNKKTEAETKGKQSMVPETFKWHSDSDEKFYIFQAFRRFCWRLKTFSGPAKEKTNAFTMIYFIYNTVFYGILGYNISS